MGPAVLCRRRYDRRAARGALRRRRPQPGGEPGRLLRPGGPQPLGLVAPCGGGRPAADHSRHRLACWFPRPGTRLAARARLSAAGPPPRRDPQPDQVGSVTAITDNTGALVATTRYTPYGIRTAHTGTADSAIGFTGALTDPDTGLVYLQARDYDPTTGQFLTIDPAVENTDQPYAYAVNNPLQNTDPTGLCSFTNCLGEVAQAAYSVDEGAANLPHVWRRRRSRRGRKPRIDLHLLPQCFLLRRRSPWSSCAHSAHGRRRRWRSRCRRSR